MKVKAAVVRAVGQAPPFAVSRPYSVEEVELDGPGPGEALVRIKAAGVCHSDISAIRGIRPRALPFVPGHEAAGVIEKLGPDVSDFVVGDHVVASVVGSCGACSFCTSGHPALCESGLHARAAGTLRSHKTRLAIGTLPINHFSGVSAFAEAAVISTAALVRIPRDIPLDLAAVCGCAVITGVGTVLNVGGLCPGDSAAIIGLGGVGFSGLLAAHLSGVRRLVALDVDQRKLGLARRMGATDVYDARETDLVARILEETSGGLDMAFEFVGSGSTIALAYEITRRGGTTVTAGICPPTETYAFGLQRLVVEKRTLKGSFMGDSVPRRDIPRYLELYRRGRLPIDKLLSGRCPLDEINVALDRLERGEVIRQVILFD